MVKRHSFYLLIVVFIQLHPAIAQRAKQPVSSQSESSDAISAFDINATKLFPNYTGHDIAALYARLEKKTEPKGEFESTEQYQARMKAAKVGVSDYTYAFKIEPSRIDKSFFTYDADTQIMKFEVSYSYISDAEESYMAESKQGIKLKDATSRSTYVGENRFGAKTNILRLTGDYFYVSLGKLKDRSLKINFQMPPESARQAKPYLAALVIGRIVPDSNSKVIYKGKTGHKPTMDMPVEADITEKSISFDLKQAWIYNTQYTGTQVFRYWAFSALTCW